MPAANVAKLWDRMSSLTFILMPPIIVIEIVHKNMLRIPLVFGLEKGFRFRINRMELIYRREGGIRQIIRAAQGLQLIDDPLDAMGHTSLRRFIKWSVEETNEGEHIAFGIGQRRFLIVVDVTDGNI